MKNPRYLKPTSIGLNANGKISFKTESSSNVHPASRNKDLCGLKDIPVALQNRSNSSLKMCHYVMVPFPNNNTSSTNSKCVIIKPFSTKTPSIFLYTTSFWMVLLNPSTTCRNNNGDNGHPCLNPLELFKKLKGLPLIKIGKFAIVTHPIIQSIVSRLNPTWSKTNLKKPQSTWSYAFIISSLRIKDLLFFTFILGKASCATPMAYVICLPSRKPNVSFDIRVEREALTLAAIIFEIIL